MSDQLLEGHPQDLNEALVRLRYLHHGEAVTPRWIEAVERIFAPEVDLGTEGWGQVAAYLQGQLVPSPTPITRPDPYNPNEHVIVPSWVFRREEVRENTTIPCPNVLEGTCTRQACGWCQGTGMYKAVVSHGMLVFELERLVGERSRRGAGWCWWHVRLEVSGAMMRAMMEKVAAT